ncbi:flagellar hook-length control protein FliK [Methylobacterium sp. J-048]|uniref:flagellar hook-length control protein FliK n=1 Tax=Methylobacterium sp. J-048 TaxID=2836635 RepID=UPI001FBA33E1|nr:flagellar hook-length control protein FliK [Methylobacterium sp. J-048]MCJ2058091.1 flagellar hook-length control protein FliK [Methylobacterium sp. J-048]
MNPISAAVQNPTPKPDRDVGPPSANGDTPQQQGTGRESAFGAVLRKLSGADSSSSADTEAATGKPDDTAGEAPPEVAVAAEPAPITPVSSAAALLANLLSVALPAVAAADSRAPAPVQDRSIEAALVPAAGSLSASVLGATGASAGTSLGSVSTPIRIPAGDAKAQPASADDVAPTDGATDAKDPVRADSAARMDDLARANGAPRADITKTLQAAAAKIEVLGRAVHFKPVVSGGAPATEAAPAGTTEPAAAAAGAEIATATPQVARPEGPALNATAAALKLPLQIQSEPDPRRAIAMDTAAGAASETPMMIAPGQGHAVSGVERAVLAAVGERAEDSSAASAAPRDGTGTATSLPAGSLPLIATTIREELERATAAAASQGGLQADPAANAVPVEPLRMLKIQLRPEDLGVVTVEMRLSNGQLETHLRASQPETAALLHKDTAILTDLLNQGGYKADVIVGQARPTETGAGGSQQQASPSFTDGGARPGNEGARQRQDGQRQAASNRREGERTDEAVRPCDGGVYL